MRSNHKSKGGLGCGEAGAVVPPSLAPPAASVGVAPPPTGTAKAGNGSRGVESNSKVLATLGLRQGELARVLKNDAPTPVVTLLTRTAYRMVKNQTVGGMRPFKGDTTKSPPSRREFGSTGGETGSSEEKKTDGYGEGGEGGKGNVCKNCQD